MDQFDISLLEQFLLSENKQKFVDSLPSSNNHNQQFLKFLLIIQKDQQMSSNIFQNDKKQFDKFLKEFGTQTYIEEYPQTHILDFLKLLKQYGTTTDLKEQEKIIQTLKTAYFKPNLSFSKPSGLQETLSKSQENSNLIQSELDQNEISTESFIKRALEQQNQLHNISDECLIRVQDSQIKGEKYQIESQLNDFFERCDLHNLNDSITDYIDKYVSSTKPDILTSGRMPQNIYQKLALKQLQKISGMSQVKNDDQFWMSYFQKVFGERLEQFITTSFIDLSKVQLRSLVKLLLEMIDWSNQNLNQSYFYSFSDICFYQILYIGAELEEYNEQYFMQFLKNPFDYHNSDLQFSQDYYTDLKKRERYYNDQFNIVNASTEKQNQIVEQYLRFFMLDTNLNKILANYQKFFKIEYLKNLYYTTKLMQGEDINKLKNDEDILQFVSQEQLDELSKKKQITICKSNDRFLGQGQEVVLHVDIKNIQSLTVKCFEINTENYYHVNKGKFDNALNLEGINPVDQQSNFEFNKNTMLVKRHEFKFEKLSQALRGVFVVEFLGNGVTSRAVIRKGGLAFLEKKTLAGHLLTLISEDQKICQADEKNPHTGIYIKGNFIPINNKGLIMVPYQKIQENVPIILCHNDFSDMSELNIQTEFYDFKCAFLYNSESFLSGNKAKVIIQSVLFINEIQANLNIIDDQIVSVVLYNEQNIPTTYQFKDIKFSNEQDIQIDIPIQNLVRSITINVSGRIKKMDNEYQNLTANHDIKFQLYEGVQQKQTLCLLKNDKQNYVLNLIGKNGELKKNVEIKLQIKNKYSQSPYTKIYKTNAKGEINLGKLSEIEQVNAEVQNSEVQLKKQFIIEEKTQLDFPSSIQQIEGEVISLPAVQQEINNQLYSFYKIFNDEILENCLKNITFKKGHLNISGLSPGNYVLKIKFLNNLEIKIKIIKGKYLIQNADKYIIEDQSNKFYGLNPTNLYNFYFSNFKIANYRKEQNLCDVILKFLLPENESLNTTRVHIFAYNFNEQNMNVNAEKLRKLTTALQQSQFSFGMKKSVYLSDKLLGDEICYVIDRQNQKKYIGNTLEKPNILLKRTFNRDTQFDKEVLQQDQDYKDGLNQRFQDEKAKVSNSRQLQQQYDIQQDLKDSMLNFLLYPTIVFANLRVNQDGEVVLKDLPTNYQCLQVIASNLYSNVQTNFNLQKQNFTAPQYKDQRLVSNLKIDQFYTEKRGSIVLKKGEKTQIKADCESLIIDNIPQLFEIQKQLILTHKGQDLENAVGYQFWDFLKDWPLYKQEEKLKKYDQFACHEINIFLYFKDKQFFNDVVSGFLKNKIEKTFVDHFLLQNKEFIIKYKEPQHLDKLNYMEKNLLILSLIKLGFKEQATSIMKAMDLENKNNIIDTNQKKRLFDTVISAISKSPKKEQPKQIYAQMMSAPFMPMNSMAPQRMMMNQAALDFDDQEDILEQRKQFKQGYQKLKKTKEYVERTYYGLKNPNDSCTFIQKSSFWSDLANFLVNNEGDLSGFMNENFIFSSRNHAEMICVLAFTDFTFKGGEYKLEGIEGRKLEITANQNNLHVFLKDTTQCESNLSAGISVTQRFFDPKDRYAYLEDDPNIQIEKDVDDFLIDKMYGCQTIITNCSVANLEFQVLTEIPHGSLPLMQVEYTKSHTLYINSYETKKLEFFFYFPDLGKYSIFPANVSRNEKTLARANFLGEIDVLAQKKIRKMETFMDILRNGNKSDILQFIENKNILNNNIFKFSDIYWLALQDKIFYLDLMKILKKRNIYDYNLLLISIEHKIPEYFNELLNCKEFQKQKMNDKNTKVYYINNLILKIDAMQLFEYHPLMTSRIHKFMNQQKSKILNIEFKKTYDQFIRYLVWVGNLQPQHLLTWCYYLLLQEKINECIDVFEKINEKSIKYNSRIQYDYMKCYLDIYRGAPNFSQARNISAQYINYPVLSWRNLFLDLYNQLKEYDGTQIQNEDQVKETELNKNQKVAESEENITMDLDKDTLFIYYQNLSELEINYYEIDLEILFSRSPFINQERQEFSFVKANLTQNIQLKKQQSLETLKNQIPNQLIKKNLYIQVKSSNKILYTNYFSNELQVQVIENYGQVKVLNQNNQPLSKIYIKTFAKEKNGKQYFYRDGYTDMRGRFDYALSSSSDISSVEKFSILISSEDLGCVIKEANVPSKIGIIREQI